MGEALLKARGYSLEEWIDLENNPTLNPEGIRYEYHYGEVYAMAGGTLNHSRLSKNATVALENSFAANGQNCEAFQSEVKIEVDPRGKYVYPDTLVVCGEIDESEHVKGSIRNPIVVVEVLSPSSEAYDLYKKFKYYFNLPSVREYLVISQEAPDVILYRRQKDSHLYLTIPYDGLEAEIHFKSINVKLKLADLYRKVVFDTNK